MLYELAALSLHNMLRARARLLMTAGGVMIGTTAVILLIAFTFGLQDAAEAGIGDDASLTQITIRTGFRRDSTSPTLDADAVSELAALDNVKAVIPILSLSGQVELRTGTLRGSAQIYGIYPETLSYLGLAAEEGTLTLSDTAPYNAVLGGTIPDSFVDRSSDTFESVYVDVMNEPIQMRVYSQGGSSYRSLNLTINAVLETGSTQDSVIYLPISTVIDLNERITGSQIDASDLTFSQIIVVATSRDTAGTLIDAITDLGYNATGMGSYLSQLNSFFDIMRVMLGGVGGVALLVSAFGVANTMMMAILERTREIGLMKAIGATDQAVLTIFLIEAGMVGLLGGGAGLVISYGVESLVNSFVAQASSASVSFLNINISDLGGTLIAIPAELSLAALALATCIGIGAGFYPSMRAARMMTVTALKTE